MDSPDNSPPNSPNPLSASRPSLAHRPARRDNPDPGSNAANAPIPDEDHGADLPLTMSASVVLSSLPRDAHKALADVENVDTGKGKYISSLVNESMIGHPGNPLL